MLSRRVAQFREPSRREEQLAARERALGQEFLEGGLAQGTLLRRLPTLSEIAETAAFLASDRSGAVTGTVINLSGAHWWTEQRLCAGAAGFGATRTRGVKEAGTQPAGSGTGRTGHGRFGGDEVLPG